jgi:hypothetical protein
LIWEGKEQLERHRTLSSTAANDPILKNIPQYYEMTREEKFKYLYMKMNRLLKLNVEELSYTNIFYYLILFGGVSEIQILNVNYIGCKYSSSWYV